MGWGLERKSHPTISRAPPSWMALGVQKQDHTAAEALANASTFYQSEVSLINIFSLSPLLRSLIWPEAAQSFKKQSKRQRRKPKCQGLSPAARDILQNHLVPGASEHSPIDRGACCPKARGQQAQCAGP